MILNRYWHFLFSHGCYNLVLLSGVSVVKNSEQIFPGAIDCLAQQEVGEEKLVALVVKLVVSILISSMSIMIIITVKETHGSGSPESLFSGPLQHLVLEAGKLLVEMLEGILADVVHALPSHDNVEEHLRQQLNPDGEVVHASSSRK